MKPTLLTSPPGGAVEIAYPLCVEGAEHSFFVANAFDEVISPFGYGLMTENSVGYGTASQIGYFIRKKPFDG